MRKVREAKLPPLTLTRPPPCTRWTSAFDTGYDRFGLDSDHLWQHTETAVTLLDDLDAYFAGLSSS
jgi:hypothetical protein